MLCGFLEGTETLSHVASLFDTHEKRETPAAGVLWRFSPFFFLHYWPYTLFAFNILSLNYRAAVSTPPIPPNVPHPVPSAERLLFLKRYKGQ